MNYYPALILAVLSATVFPALASDNAMPPSVQADPTPTGRWKTIDDKTGKVSSYVVIAEQDGQLTGTIEKLVVEPGEDPTPKCDKCKGELKDKPVVGMRILWDLKRDAKNRSEWNGGKIMDPDNGETYRCYIEVIENGRKLKVRGYLGIALFGRTQYWVRAEKAEGAEPARP